MSGLQAAPSSGGAGPVARQVFEREGFRQTLASATMRKVPPGELIIVQGRQGKAAFFIASGDVEVLSETAYGSVRLAALSSPRLVGEVGALAGLPRTASIRALTEVTVYRIDREDLVALGRQEPELLLSIVAELGRQLDGFNRTISLYANALSALERSEFDPRILDDLTNPPPQTAAFTEAFRRFADQIVSKRRQEAEMASAAAIQRSLLPDITCISPFAHDIELQATIRPAREVGGDFYDFFLLDDQRLVVAVGDVCGKGLPASLFAAIAVTVLRTTLRDETSLDRAMARANAILCRDNAASMFATLFIGVLDVGSGRLEYCNCGHNAPLIVSGKSMRHLPATGLPLAMLDDRVASVSETNLAPNDILILYSDGITEALNVEGEEFGDERLADAVADLVRDSAANLVQGLVTAADCFAGGAEQADDMTCLAVRLLGRSGG